MLQFKKKSKSITFILVSAMLFIVFVQFVLVAGAVLSSNVVPKLEDNAAEIFSQSTISKRNYLEGEMHNRWSQIDTYLSEFERLYPVGETEKSEQATVEYLDSVSNMLVAMLRGSGANGAFIILDDGTQTTSNSCLYLTDSDPQHNNIENNSDLMVLKGPLEVSEKLNVPLHVAWNYGLYLDDEIKDIFLKPYNAALSIGSRAHLGYWQSIPSMAIPNEKSIMYTVPLINSQKQVFGVAGIEISQGYFFQMMPMKNTITESMYGYSVIQSEGEDIYPILTQSTQLQTMMPYGTSLSFSAINEDFDSYLLESSEQQTAACIKEIALYNKNTPFSDTRWYLVAFFPKDSLFSNSRYFSTTVTIALIASFAIGSILAIVVGWYVTQPTVSLMKSIKNFTPDKRICLERTGVMEIDELSGAVEQLNDDVLNYALKTDKIISMVNLDIGSFEYDFVNNRVKLSPALSRMLELTTDANECVGIDVFNECIAKVRKNKSVENIYKYKENPDKWLKLESVTIDNGEFGVAVDVTKEELTKQSIIYERDHDYLTGIFNRFAFKKEITELFDNKNFEYGAFILGDLDNLKHINDIYGHDLGDIYIRKTATVISQYLEDKNAIYGRMSGDEFYIFIYGDEQEKVKEIAYGLSFALNCESITLTDGSIFKLKMSCGVAWYPFDSVDIEILTRYADFAMYQGKHTVKGGIRDFDANAYSESAYMFTGKEELYTILEQQLCDYVFQPIYDVANEKTYGYEALMRPYGKTINTPDKLLRIATAQGQLYKIEHNTFYMVFELFKKYLPLLEEKKMFINSIPNQILGDQDYLNIEQTYPELLNRVVIEITENEAIGSDSINRKKQLVKNWGALLAVDDYGSGYANDLSLIKLQPDIVKIDCMIVDGIDSDKNKQSIVKKTVEFAREVHMTVLAEGVETKEQLETLVNMGVNLLQGYYISRPCPLPNFDDRAITGTVKTIKKEKIKSVLI